MLHYKVLALTAVVSLANAACTFSLKPLQSANIDPQAIYAQNTGKRITQAKVLAQVAVGYEKLGQQDMAAKLLSPAMQTAKVNSSIHYQTEMWGEVGASYVKMGRYNDALQAAQALATQKYQGSADGDVALALDRIIRELVAAKQLDKATQVAQLISSSSSITSYVVEVGEEYEISQPMALTRLAGEYTKAGQREKALKVLDQALQQRTDLAAIALAYAAVGQQNQALQFLSQATRIDTDEHTSLYSNDFIKAAVAYAAMGQKDQALQLLAQIKEKVKQQEASNPMGGHYLHRVMMEIAVGYAEIGEYHQALQFAKTIQPSKDLAEEAGRTPGGLISGSTSNEVFVFTQLAGRFAEAKQYNLALQAIQAIKGEGNIAVAKAKLAVEYARAKQYDRAFQLLRQSKQLTVYGALPQVVEAVVRAERGDRAVQLLTQALEVAGTPDKPLILRDARKDLALAAIAKGYAEIGQREQAQPLLAQARQIAAQIHGEAEKAVALATIASGYAARGQREQAEPLLAQARQIGEGINR
ncbi:hypothetical protein H6F76_03655 [Leptolyngbya sp. FACHB-321]|uniref:tetratricopeptide repeat protein n=1 Tax=Leptolyngbya sp. FACHB-321 TaxID=2692807 RepID=UPI0016853D62|nr:hypothetical protein [Leptolyngbya sp. FACHB-321]MBD2034142.1 hypothetical protein [Leptolyngbya sp. FACHB-321]